MFACKSCVKLALFSVNFLIIFYFPLYNKNTYDIFIMIVRRFCPILNRQGCKIDSGNHVV